MGCWGSYIVAHVVLVSVWPAIYRQRTSRQRLIMLVSLRHHVGVSKQPGWQNVLRSSSPPLPLVWVSIRLMYAMSSMLVHRIVSRHISSNVVVLVVMVHLPIVDYIGVQQIYHDSMP